ncbi:MAG: hypothetical protein FD180_2694 [Planctomycetota bacterium]|nr:MAG: hypothetical protein FD180_2694 [Planctomycetota bacterium]
MIADRIRRTRAVGGRVMVQLVRDHRFLALALLVPVAVVYLLHVFLGSVNSPFFDPARFAVPLGAFIVHFLTYVLTAIVLVRERTGETLPRMFACGYRQGEIITGYLTAYTALASVQSLIVLAELAWLFELDYPWTKFLSIALVIWLLAVISMSLGILVSNFARTEGQVLPFVPAVIIPSIFLSGVVIPPENLPAWARVLGWFTPLFHADAVLVPLLKSGGSMADAGWSLAGLPCYGVAVLALASLTLRERD